MTYGFAHLFNSVSIAHDLSSQKYSYESQNFGATLSGIPNFRFLGLGTPQTPRTLPRVSRAPVDLTNSRCE